MEDEGGIFMDGGEERFAVIVGGEGSDEERDKG